MKIQIRSWRDGSVLFETDAETIGNAVVAAIAAKSNLSSANLRFADLRSANLGSADLSSADLSSADLLKLLPIRTILPDGDLIGWKKLQDGIICKLRIPAKAKRIGGLVGRKCRAEYAIVIGPSGVFSRDKMKYTKGKRVTPDKFDPNPLIECSHGIHFFITKEEAEAYEL